MISAQALGYLQCLHRTPRLLDPSGSLDITPQHSISAEFKQRPWKICQKHHIIHTLCLFLKKKKNGIKEFTVNETMICRVWPKSYIAVSTNAALDGLIKQKHIGWGCWYLRKSKSIADHHLLPDSFKKISVLASFSRDTNLITQREDSCAVVLH